MSAIHKLALALRASFAQASQRVERALSGSWEASRVVTYTYYFSKRRSDVRFYVAVGSMTDPYLSAAAQLLPILREHAPDAGFEDMKPAQFIQIMRGRGAYVLRNFEARPDRHDPDFIRVSATNGETHDGSAMHLSLVGFSTPNPNPVYS